MLEEGQYLYFPVVNYVTGDHEPIREMLNDPACLLGLSDGGAHCTSIIDAGVPSYMLTHWGRDRSAGRRCRSNMLVKRQTSETADFFGLTDRGRLAPGLRADVNVIDFDALKLHKPELVHDMPANGRRFVQRVDGLRGDAGRWHADLRARPAHRRDARPARARRPQWRDCKGGLSCDRQYSGTITERSWDAVTIIRDTAFYELRALVFFFATVFFFVFFATVFFVAKIAFQLSL